MKNPYDMLSVYVKPDNGLIIGLDKARIALVFVIVASFALALFPIGEASAFYQIARIHIDKGAYELGTYGVILRNTDVDTSTKKYLTDSVDSPQKVYVPLGIDALDGERLQACVMKMTSQDIICDYGYADSSVDYLDFYISMDTNRYP
jgi:hypothetical protein